MRKQQWTVRIILNDTNPERLLRDREWLGEFLRYAGHTRCLKSSHDAFGGDVYELRCPSPKEHNTKVWADQNAERLRSFGLNAAAAPLWDGGPLEEGS